MGTRPPEDREYYVGSEWFTLGAQWQWELDPLKIERERKVPVRYAARTWQWELDPLKIERTRMRIRAWGTSGWQWELDPLKIERRLQARPPRLGGCVAMGTRPPEDRERESGQRTREACGKWQWELDPLKIERAPQRRRGAPHPDRVAMGTRPPEDRECMFGGLAVLPMLVAMGTRPPEDGRGGCMGMVRAVERLGRPLGEE